MGLFKKGYSAVREEKQRQDEAREKAGKNLFRLFLSNDGDEADVRFLTEEPINFYEHTVKNTRNGKEFYDTYVCSNEDCPLCKGGDRPTFKGAFLVYDMRPYETKDKDGKKIKKEGSVKLYVQGAKVLSQLDRLSSKYGIIDRVLTIIRLGKGTNTTYTIERGDRVGKLSKEEIKNILPEALKEDYNGTSESLYNIVEKCLENQVAGNDVNSFSSDDEDEEEYDNRKNLVGVDDEDEEETPKTTFKSGKSLKKPNSSLKPKPTLKKK